MSAFINNDDLTVENLLANLPQPKAFIVETDIDGSVTSDIGVKTPNSLFFTGGSRVNVSWANWPARKQRVSR
jgi:hypothetical protein